MNKEKCFYETLKNLFIGVPVEGESGYINLMRIKARYFESAMRPELQKLIAQELQPFPDFREELFDKLYTFFKRYFTESGSIGFFFTPYHQSVYEQVYTDDRDVLLFWKTQRLYYVKTDRLFQSMQIEIDGFRFYFDVVELEHKRANEKRSLVFEFKERRGDGVLTFTVHYSERGQQTKMDDIRRAIKDALNLPRYTDAVPSEETLERAFRTFERQNEVDYFLCKDARSFLREQFDLWMWQYLLGKPGEEPQTEWTETRLKQLQALKRIAYRVIDFIAAFEDEVVKIWNKPKFVLRSNYVITLDRIHERCPELVERIAQHPRFAEQIKEWQNLGMVDSTFTGEALWENNLMGKSLHPRYRFLPIDTRYFKDLELEILSLFENLDDALDGWLIKSENYQALNTILPKFRGKVKCIYIDPPYNTGSDEFIYEDRVRHSSWLTMMENRFKIARDFLIQSGIIFVNIDEREQARLESLMEEIFGHGNSLGPFIWLARAGKAVTERQLQVAHEYVLCFGKSIAEVNLKLVERRVTNCRYRDERGGYNRELLRQWGGQHDRREDRPTLYFPIPTPFGVEVYPKRPDGSEGCWRASREQVEKMLREGDLDFVRDETTGEITVYRKIREGTVTLSAPSNILDDCGTSATATTEIKALFADKVFDTAKPVNLAKRCISLIAEENSSYILDFFAGSGTTAHAVINLNREDGGRRKYILVEMADYFYTVLLPRAKKVIFSDKWKDGKAQPDGKGISHFVKYYELEQFEDALRRTRYLDDDLFTHPQGEDPCQYIFLRDLKMTHALEVDLEQGTVTVDLSRLYEDIDLAETLSNLTGKWIRRIHPAPEDPTKPGKVEFTDGTEADLKNPDWRLIKSLIWW